MKKTFKELHNGTLIEEDRDYKDEYKKFQSTKKAIKYRAELAKYNRDKGTYGNGDKKDASHKKGKIVGFEDESINRGRKEKSRLKVNEGESRKDALKRALAIAKWKKAGGKVEKQPPSPGRGDEKMGKAVQDYKKKHKKKENRIGAGNMFKRQWKGQRKNSSFVPRGEEVGEGFQEISNLVDITQGVMTKMIKAMKKDDFKSVTQLYKELGKIIK